MLKKDPGHKRGHSRWIVREDGSRYRDPLRRIVDIQSGAGSDLLTFECGHQRSANHRTMWGTRASCLGCREWEGRSSDA